MTQEVVSCLGLPKGNACLLPVRTCRWVWCADAGTLVIDAVTVASRGFAAAVLGLGLVGQMGCH